MGAGKLPIWLMKAAVRHASRRKNLARNKIDLVAWRDAWERRDGANWPNELVTGIIETAGIKLVLDRCEITRGGHLWLDGWAHSPEPLSLQLEAHNCTIEWQATFATSRRDVVQTLQLSLAGGDDQLGFQVLAHIADHVPVRSRLALIASEGGARAKLVVPAVPQIERSGSLWHSVYDAMRQRGPRDVGYLETSVKLLKELRKADWRERSAAIRRTIDDAMPDGSGLKMLVLSRLHPNVAYLNLISLASACLQPAEIIVCSMGQAAIQRANEYRTHFATIGAHSVHFVSAEIGTPSCELIEQFVVSCRRRRAPGLIVYDDVAVASAMGSLVAALRRETPGATAWPRQFPQAGPREPAFAVPLAANDGAGPYWRSARAMEQGGLGALLFDSSGIESPPLPPFEGRGHALEFLVASALPTPALSHEAMLDLIDPASQREAQGLDMLMLLAS